MSAPGVASRTDPDGVRPHHKPDNFAQPFRLSKPELADHNPPAATAVGDGDAATVPRLRTAACTALAGPDHGYEGIASGTESGQSRGCEPRVAKVRGHREGGRPGPRQAWRGSTGVGQGLLGPLLRRGGRHRHCRARRHRPLWGRPRALAGGPPPRARRDQGPRLHTRLRGRRLGLDAHGGGGRHRRHAVPRRLVEHGAEPTRPWRPSHRPPGDHRCSGCGRAPRRAGR